MALPLPQNPSRSRAAIFAAGATIAVAAVAAYHNSLSGQFAFDDVPTIADNPTIRHLWNLRTVLSPPPGGFTVSGRPVLNFTLAINYALGGKNVWGYHAANLLIHILAGLTLFGIMRRTLGRWSELPPTRSIDGADQRVGGNALHPNTFLAFAVALIWTVHPLQTEAVTYIIQRAESLMGLFYLLTLYCFIRSTDCLKVGRTVPGTPSPPPELRTEGVPGTVRPTSYLFAGLSVAACLLGMATKEVMVSAPVIVFLYDRTFVSGTFRAAWRARRRYYLALAATWLPMAYLIWENFTRGGTIGGSTVRYWLTQFPAIVHYLRLVFWPRPLVLDYGSRLVQSPWSVLPSIVVVTALVVGTVWAFFAKIRNLRSLGFAGLFFFAILAPTSLFPVIVQVMAEHRMYLALAPVIAVIVVGGYGIIISNFEFRISKFVFLCLAAAAGLAFVTAHRNRDYRNELTLWGKTAAEAPDNPRAQYNFGIALSDAGNVPAAMERYRVALQLKPDYPEAHNNLGIALSNTGHWPESIVEYKEAVRLDPAFGKAYYNLGNAYLHVGNLRGAIVNYQAALRLADDNPDVDYNLGIALTRAGQPAEAIPVYERALQLKPDYVEVHSNLGVILDNLGRTAEAIAHYKEALRLSPNLPQTHNSLGIALAKTGHLEEATAQFEDAVRLDPGFGLAHLNLGHALMLSGRDQEARAQFEEANRLRAAQPH